MHSSHNQRALHELVLPLLLFVLCSADAHSQVAIGLKPRAGDVSMHREIVPYVTARAIEQNRHALEYYGQRRGELSAGDCTVDLGAPERHQIIGLEQRGIDEIIGRFGEAAGHVVVYVHGYNVSFEDGCRQAALFQDRVRLEQRLLLFSWPAEAKLMGYLGDTGDVEWSVVPLRNLLVSLLDRYGPNNVDVVGHSLGARAVVAAVNGVGGSPSAGKLGRVVLVAPDLDADVFMRDYGSFSEGASTIVVYVSPQDRALKASRNVRNEQRLGEGGTDLSSLPRLDVVEVVQWRWIWGSQHHYHLHNEAVIVDLRKVLSGPPHLEGSRTIRH
jgi:pimeloyl-ACP methyl ester carboxylesterase